MASAPQLVRYDSPVLPSTGDPVLDVYIRNQDWQIKQMAVRLNELLLNPNIGIVPPNPEVVPGPVLHDSFVRFPYGSGPVLYARPNSTRWRLMINDDDPDHPQPDLEAYLVSNPADMLFTDSAYGPVVQDRANGRYTRYTLNDEQQGPPIIVQPDFDVLATVNNIQPKDYAFAPLYGFILEGRTNHTLWLWIVTEGQPDMIKWTEVGVTGVGAETFLELTDTPDQYDGKSLFLLRVKEDESGVEFVECDPIVGIGYDVTTGELTQTRLSGATELVDTAGPCGS